jgi:signal transduction histidine kinase
VTPVVLGERAAAWLATARIEPADVEWREASSGAVLAVATLEEGEQVLGAARGLLLIVGPDDEAPLHLAATRMPVEVVMLPLSVAELRMRSAWLLRRVRAWETLWGGHHGTALAQRLALMGRVAASASHELGNALSYTYTNVGYLREAIDTHRLGDPELPLVARESQEGIWRALEACRTVAELSSPAAEPAPVDINETVQRVDRLLRAALPKGTSVETQAATVPQALADASALMQLLTGAVLQAADAAGAGGKVRVRTEHQRDWVVLYVTAAPRIAPGLWSSMWTQDLRKDKAFPGFADWQRWAESFGGKVEVTAEDGAVQFRICLPATEKPAESLEQLPPAHERDIPKLLM